MIVAIFLFSILIFFFTPMTFVSGLLASSLVYASPLLFFGQSIAPDVSIAWSITFFVSTIAHLYTIRLLKSSRKIQPTNRQTRNRREIRQNKILNILLLFIFIVVVIRSGGGDVFWEGKYGNIPGNSIILYYTWVSVLLLACVSNVMLRSSLSLFTVLSWMQLFLLFVSGDRTILVIFLFSVFIHKIGNVAPATYLMRRPFVSFAVIFLILPLIFVAKSIYTLLPMYGFSAKLFSSLLESDTSLLVSQNFEPIHTNMMFHYIIMNNFEYDAWTLLKGTLAFIPGSSFFGIDPHVFSDTVKAQFYGSWGPGAGIGANFWAQGYAVAGLFGVFLFSSLVAFALATLHRGYSRSDGLFRLILLTCAGIIGFYLHRNSLEQLLSFVGRVLFFGFATYTLSLFVANFRRMRTRVRTRPRIISRT